MKKKFCMTLVLIFTLALSACGKTDAPAPAVSGSTPSDTPVVSVPTPDGQTGLSPSSCTFDPALFGGKLQSCAYAGNGTLFVLADKLYLYDTGTSSVLATAEAPLRDFEAQAIDGGYVLSGMGDSGMMAYIYDSSLSLNKEIAVDELLQGGSCCQRNRGRSGLHRREKAGLRRLGWAVSV